MKKPPTLQCSNCGKLGHASKLCPKKVPKQIHAMTYVPDDASDSLLSKSLFVQQLHGRLTPITFCWIVRAWLASLSTTNTSLYFDGPPAQSKSIVTPGQQHQTLWQILSLSLSISTAVVLPTYYLSKSWVHDTKSHMIAPTESEFSLSIHLPAPLNSILIRGDFTTWTLNLILIWSTCS